MNSSTSSEAGLFESRGNAGQCAMCDSGSRFYDGYESLEEAADAISPKNLLSTVGEYFPYVLDLIEEEGGLMLGGLWVGIEDLQAGPENENNDVATSESPIE